MLQNLHLSYKLQPCQKSQQTIEPGRWSRTVNPPRIERIQGIEQSQQRSSRTVNPPRIERIQGIEQSQQRSSRTVNPPRIERIQGIEQSQQIST